jgi:glycosyltransferase involved in cell wall biosynthesis
MKFSLVIPLAPSRDAEIIESIKKLDYPKNEFHVVVVKGLNPSENRNKGAEKSKGKYIVFLDDDGVIEEDYLKNIENFLNKYPEIDIVGGPQLTPKDEKGFAKISGYGLSSKFGAWKISHRYSENKTILNVDETHLTSANLICKKNVLKKVQFDPKLFPGEDPKFISDAKFQKFKVAYTPNIKIYHRRRPTIKSLAKQIFNYGKVRPAKESFFETIKMPFFFIPSIFLIYLIVLITLVFVNPSIINNIMNNQIRNYFSSEFVLFIPLLCYIFLSLLFSIYDSAKNKDYKAIFILPFVYLIIHLSYGSGMIFGYLRKLLGSKI